MASESSRVERYLLGVKEVPGDAYYGVQTARGLENFHISGVQLRLYPDFIKALAMVTLAQEHYERSLELHEKLLRQAGPDADVLYNCGVLAQKLHELARAEQFYRDAITTRARFAEALLNLGHVLDKLGRTGEAREAWIPALELRPELALGYFRRN